MAEEKKAERPKDKDPASDTDWAWLQLPAPYCDTHAVDVWPSGVVRLTFGELTGRGYLPYFRSAVVMPIEIAREFAQDILNQIREDEEEQKVKAAEIAAKAK